MPDPAPSRRHCLALATLGSMSAWAMGTAPLQVLSYYDYPPFSTAPGQGLTQSLLALLQARAGPLLPPLREELLPRRRVAALVGRSDWRGLVPWVSPIWFQDADRHRFVWTAPLLHDEDLVVSLKTRPVDYQGPASLKGLTLGGVFGHVYPETEALVKAGEVRRLDSFNQEACLRMLLMGRVHAMFVSRSGLAGWRQRVPDFNTRLYLADTPRQRYQRRLLLSPLTPGEQSDWIQKAVAELPRDPAWLDILQQFGVDGTLS